jgi:hypothetical protein
MEQVEEIKEVEIIKASPEVVPVVLAKISDVIPVV